MSTQAPAPPRAPAPSGGSGGSGGRTALRVLVVGLGLAVVAWNAVAVASLLSLATDTRDATFSGVRVLELDLAFEDVDVTGSATTDEVTVDRGWHWSLGEPEIVTRQDGDRLVVGSSCSWTPGLPCTGWVHLTVPADVTVTGGVTDSHLTLRDLAGEVDVSTSDGGITLAAVSGPLRLESRDGSVEGTGIRSSSVSASTSDGSVRLAFADPPRSVRATSRDGSVQLTLPDDRTAYHVTVSTSDGSSDVTVPTDPTAPRRITATTSDGDVTIAPAG
jgi:hypothetical protein